MDFWRGRVAVSSVRRALRLKATKPSACPEAPWGGGTIGGRIIDESLFSMGVWLFLHLTLGSLPPLPSPLFPSPSRSFSPHCFNVSREGEERPDDERKPNDKAKTIRDSLVQVHKNSFLEKGQNSPEPFLYFSMSRRRRCPNFSYVLIPTRATGT